MNKAKIGGGMVIGFAMLSLASPAAWAGEETSPDPTQIARGAKAWAENCNRCHNFRAPGDLQDYEWDVSIAHMRVISGLPGQIARDINAFLKASND